MNQNGSIQRNRVTARLKAKTVGLIAIAFLAYLGAGKLGQATASIRSSNLGPVWPAYGVALAAVLLCGYKVWPGIAAAAFLVALLSPVSSLAAVGQAAGATIAVLTGAFFLQRVVHFNPSLSRLRDALALITIGALGSALVSASIGVSVLNATQVQAYSGLGSAWLVYWLGDSTGVLLVTPVVLTLGHLLRVRTRVRVTEFVALLVILAGISFLIFADLPFFAVRLHVLAFAVLPFVMWAAIRFGISGTAVATLLVATVATVETALGKGPFAQNSTFMNAVLLDVFFAILAVSGMTLAGLIGEREQAQHEREQLLREQVAMEARLQLATAIESSEERFHLAAQAGKMYAYEWDAETDVVTRSEEYVNVLGLSRRGKQLTREELSTVVHPDDRARFLSFANRLTPEHPTGKISYRVLHPDGSVIWVEKNARGFFDTQGRLRRIIGMVADVTHSKRAEEALRESEDKLRMLLDSTAEAIYGIDVEGRCTFCNSACVRVLGYERVDEILGHDMHRLLCHSHADGTPIPVDECRMYRALRAGVGIHVEDEMVRRANGTGFPVEYWCYPQRRGEEVVGAVVAFIDITERKQAEEALANVSRRLLEAQEKERARIARELHDDIGQRLALLAIHLDQIYNASSDLSEVRRRIRELQELTLGIANDVQSLSHELHSSKLEYLGLATAMQGFCKEFGQQQGVEVNLAVRDLPMSLPPDVSLCVFRILQEALHNALKHSGVRSFSVDLWATSDEIHLLIEDLGVGFDPEIARQSRGLGLISMEERLRMVNGNLSIDSQLNQGTVIHARVPLYSKSGSTLAAG